MERLRRAERDFVGRFRATTFGARGGAGVRLALETAIAEP